MEGRGTKDWRKGRRAESPFQTGPDPWCIVLAHQGWSNAGRLSLHPLGPSHRQEQHIWVGPQNGQRGVMERREDPAHTTLAAKLGVERSPSVQTVSLWALEHKEISRSQVQSPGPATAVWSHYWMDSNSSCSRALVKLRPSRCPPAPRQEGRWTWVGLFLGRICFISISTVLFNTMFDL